VVAPAAGASGAAAKAGALAASIATPIIAGAKRIALVDRKCRLDRRRKASMFP
jgi:hypothetical protein